MNRIPLSLLALLLLVPAWGQQEAAVPLTLEDALARAWAHQPAMSEAAARAAGADAVAARSRASQRPQLRLDSRYAVTSEVPEVAVPLFNTAVALGEKTNWVTTLGASQVLYSGGRLEGAARQADSLARAAEMTRARVNQQVRFETTRAFYTLLAAQQERAAALQTLTAAQKHLRAAQARLEARAAPRYDVLRAEVQVEEARQELVRAESGLAVAHAAVLRALGETQGRYQAVDGATPAPMAPPSVAQALAEAYGRRPELQAAEWQLRAAEGAVQAAKGERRPTLSLAGEYQIASPQTPLHLTSWTAALFAGLPILDGGAARAKLREAEALRDQSAAARESLRVAIAAEVRAALARVESAHEQYAVAQKRLALAEETRRIADVRYREGVGTPVEVADAQSVLARARQGMTRAMTDWQIARAELRYVMGTED
ncbi:MAG TPA: TolC family protein [Armatimonadota bacterium]|mgnify:CR=1 FL=1|nr:TolC family protein [Armatimonadota bacterium]HOS42144.1 TolC family protein [Armatimonadota bacterium]